MKSILQKNKECYVSGATAGLHKHHIFFGNGLRSVWLRANLHNGSDRGVHFDRAFDLQLKRECQEKYEETHTREDFMRLIGRNYL